MDEPQLNKEMSNLFVKFITEREAIRVKKDEDLPQPWTEDQILHDWRFCNINRCHDRETIWIFKNIIDEHKDSDSLWFNLVIARFINWRETLDHLGYFDAWDITLFRSVILQRQKKKQKVYTGAYLIPSGDAGILRHDFLADDIFTKLWDDRANIPTVHNCKEWSKFLRQARGMGDFMRNQIITDMKYTRYLPKDKTEDWKLFCLAGPGTMRGLNRILDLPLNKKWKPPYSNLMLRAIRGIVVKDVSFSEYFDDLNNLSNCFCEFDKYIRVLNGEGKPRSRYVRTVDEF